MAAEEVAKGSKVRTGHRAGSDDWAVQSVSISAFAGKSKARFRAEQTIEKLEE